MTVHHGSAVWRGKLSDGQGVMQPGRGDLQGEFSFCSRFEDCQDSSPEEFIGAAHSGCFSMYLSHLLGEEGYRPVRIETKAEVEIVQEKEIKISSIHLDTEVEAEGLDQASLETLTQRAKEECPVSKALAGVEKVTVKASLSR